MQAIFKARVIQSRATDFARVHVTWLVVLSGFLVAWWAGSAVATGNRRTLALELAALGVAGPIIWSLIPDRIREGFLAVEFPMLLLLCSTLIFRERTADELAFNPLDPAGQFRVACTMLALLLGALAFTSSSVRATPNRVAVLPFRLYALYIVVVFLGAALSVNLMLTAYRGIELLAGLLVVGGAWKRFRGEAIPRLEAVLYWFLVVMVISAWLGLFFFPSEAVIRSRNTYVPVKWQLRGVLLIQSSNSLGLFGVFMALWSLVRGNSPWRSRLLRPFVSYLLAAVGAWTVIATQYRTGYVALTLGLIVLLLLKGRVGLAGFLVAVAFGIVLWNPSVVTEAQPYVLRGQTVERARELSDRVDWWKLSVPVWEKSPLIGRGLLTATRFEVLAPIGRKSTSTIHGTWFEALVGTGIVGLMLVAGILLVVAQRALRLAVTGRRWILPVVLVVVICIRSITGSTIEIYNFIYILFLWIALAVVAMTDPVRPPPLLAQGVSS